MIVICSQSELQSLFLDIWLSNFSQGQEMLKTKHLIKMEKYNFQIKLRLWFY